MNKEEAIERLKTDIYKYADFTENPNENEFWMAFDMAIKALEQQTGEDAISREDALMALTGEWTEPTDELIHRFIRRIKKLPSVNPQPKTGHWIYTSKRRLVDETDDGGVYITDYRCTCSACGGDFGFQKMRDAYCKYCGAKMVEPQESEVSE